MDASPARVDPEEVLKSKVLPECPVQDLDGDGHEPPALVTDGGAFAARPHVVVVGHVNIEHELLFYSLKRVQRNSNFADSWIT